MKLYHGSNIKIQTIDLEKGRLGKDFGKGFYLSSEYEQAERMAQITSVRRGGEPMITTFVFDETKLCDKNLMNKDIQFLIECLSEDLIAMLMETYDYSLDEAADVLYKSNTYRLIENIDSELYYQSSVYVFDMLKEEIEQKEEYIEKEEIL